METMINTGRLVAESSQTGQEMGENSMGIENFLKRWSIRESMTTVIAVGDQLHIDRVGNSGKVDFRCDSPNTGTPELWDAVKDCRWLPKGGPAGHLQGTISDQSGGDFPLVITYAAGSPDRIHLEVVAMPISGGDVVAMGGGGGGAGNAGGDDDPP